jgi:CheY-like chemotaxis protein
MTVLVSYEGLALRAAMYQLLTKAGYEVLVAPPSAALAAVRVHGPVDMLVTDYEAPANGRLDLAGRLKAQQPGLRVLYAPGADGPIEAGLLLHEPGNAERLVTAVEGLSAADKRWSFCAL